MHSPVVSRRPFIIDSEHCLTYVAFRDAVETCEGPIVDRCDAGDRIAILMGNSRVVGAISRL